MLGLSDGRKWLAVAGEWPPQKLRHDHRAGVANSGVLLLSGLPIAGAGMLEMLERWVWPTRDGALPTFTWPYEQNALTFSLIAEYEKRVVLLRPGCPLNTPFGAYVRHYVGGTPDRSVYHRHHGLAWLLQAMRCTVRLVLAAANMSRGAALSVRAPLAVNRVGEPSRRRARPLPSLGALAPLLRQAGCAANEPTLVLNVGGGCGRERDGWTAIYRNVRPVGAAALVYLAVSCWQVCCAQCMGEPRCGAWAFHEDWRANSLNCMLFDEFEYTLPSMGRLLGRWIDRSTPAIQLATIPKTRNYSDLQIHCAPRVHVERRSSGRLIQGHLVGGGCDLVGGGCCSQRRIQGDISAHDRSGTRGGVDAKHAARVSSNNISSDAPAGTTCAGMPTVRARPNWTQHPGSIAAAVEAAKIAAALAAEAEPRAATRGRSLGAVGTALTANEGHLRRTEGNDRGSDANPHEANADVSFVVPLEAGPMASAGVRVLGVPIGVYSNLSL